MFIEFLFIGLLSNQILSQSASFLSFFLFLRVSVCLVSWHNVVAARLSLCNQQYALKETEILV
jgi:hypothetical protein